MTEAKIRAILKNHGVTTMRINDILYAEGYYTYLGVLYSELLPVDPEKATVGTESLYHWLGY